MADSEVLAAIAAMEADNEVLTAEAPGPWAGKEGKHVPLLSLADGKASVVVPHGMDDSHFIQYIYIKNPDGDVVAAVEYKVGEMDGVAQGTLEVDTPEGAADLTPYAYCNEHGLWKGDSVAVA
uniref:Desulfoferrodoxin ferrous iron-binding domain-containing protein n=1 Tax=Pinguiococcus pyrenoidosus TaxID=172671 RepID=A0A7R9YEN7_9STRA|mmetsp:Transcript_702/g.2838  ORF Transcript_702/g.2838 Transcript_702/m.2838 type:complete len:123 (+) Transcript_702:85-453(+)